MLSAHQNLRFITKLVRISPLIFLPLLISLTVDALMTSDLALMGGNLRQGEVQQPNSGWVAVLLVQSIFVFKISRDSLADSLTGSTKRLGPTLLGISGQVASYIPPLLVLGMTQAYFLGLASHRLLTSRGYSVAEIPKIWQLPLADIMISYVAIAGIALLLTLLFRRVYFAVIFIFFYSGLADIGFLFMMTLAQIPLPESYSILVRYFTIRAYSSGPAWAPWLGKLVFCCHLVGLFTLAVFCYYRRMRAVVVSRRSIQHVESEDSPAT